MHERTFLHRYLELNEGTEIPDLFALWSGLAALSCVMGRKLWLDMGIYKVYPNLFIILVGSSGRFRKSTAIGVAESLISELDPQPNLIAQRITPEGLIDATRSQKVEAKGKSKAVLKETCEGFVVADELSTFLNKKTYEGLAPLLIPMYDCKNSFEYRTKGRGSEKIKEACLSMLTASTVDWIKEAIPPEAVGGGLTSRFAFVYVDKPPKPVAITSFSKEKIRLKESLVKELSEIGKVKGIVKFDKKAEELYVELYNTFYEESPLFEDRSLSGYASRRHVLLMKIGLILTASEKNLIIEPRHLEASLATLERIEVNLPRVLRLIVSTEQGNLKESIHRKIQSKQKITRTELTRSFSHRILKSEFEEIMSTLVIEGRVRQTVSGRTIYYQAID